MKTKIIKNSLMRTLFGHLMLIVLIAAMIPAVPSEASAKSAALAKYRQLLKSSKVRVLPRGSKTWVDYDTCLTYSSSKASDVKFSIAYIDRDNIPDLVLRDRRYGYGVWTYKGNTLRCLHWADSFDIPEGYYKKKGVFRNNSYKIGPLSNGKMFYRVYFKLQTGKKPKELQFQTCYKGENGLESLGYHIGTRNVFTTLSRSLFYKELKKYTGGANITKLHMHANTLQNRNKYIK